MSAQHELQGEERRYRIYFDNKRRGKPLLKEYAAIAQLVERIHGKDEVLGSNPSRGSIFVSNPGHERSFMLE